MKSYDHKKIEKKWQESWSKAKLYETKDSVTGKENFYLLVEFPYPSGNLHVGHWYSFAVPDILARMLRMKGKNVMYPIGFDAFGLPAENAAIKNKLNPRTWTEGNIEYMKKQIASMGGSFDWSREVITCHPDYYRWTQWLFLQLFKKGLVYRKETLVNWCPNDKTVLANEQVVDGKCERCGFEVVQREMLQWNIKITDYADRLIDDLEPLDWPKEIKESQRNWIGRSEGAEIDFPLEFAKQDGPKPNYLILHGYTGLPGKNFIPWLKSELEKRGFEVQAPEMPNSDNPKESEQVEYVLQNCKIDERTIIVGHSLGGIVAMKALQKRNEHIAGLVLIASAVEPRFRTGEPRPFWDMFSWDFDYQKIKSLSGFQLILSDSLEAEHRLPYLKYLSEQLQAPLAEGTAKRKHFTSDVEPFILTQLLPHLTVFTTRADTLFGATYLVLSPEHPWVTLALGHKTVLKNNEEVAAYVDSAKKKSELERMADQKEKTGVKIEGVVAINPATGEKIPLYVADYVLANYGTGAIMAVPAHDDRDYEFAQKFHLPIKEVVESLNIQTGEMDAVRNDMPFEERNAIMAVVRHWSKEEYLCLRWKSVPIKAWVTGGIEQDEDPIEAAKREIREETGYLTPEFVRSLGGRVHAKFYSKAKSVNRFAHFTPLLFQLKNSSQEEVSAEERAIQDVQWVPTKEVSAFINRQDMLSVWGRVNGNFIFTGQGILINSGEYDGLTIDEAKKAITEKFGRTKTTYKLRDWIVSRQRYWGVPIPIIHCAKCGSVPVPDESLPVLLPETDDYLPEGSGKSPLAKISPFVDVQCPQCGGAGERETDTLDTFVDSSWYFLRYSDPKNKKEFAAQEKMDAWMPVDLYSGGAEHTTMHLLYSRFWQKALFDIGLVKDAEPYLKRMNRSIILGPDGQKMSKSKGNVIDPDEIVERLGADTVRLYLAFVGPYNEVASYPWNPDGVVGVRRFLERIWRAHELIIESSKLDDVKYKTVDRVIHRAIRKVGEDIAVLKFNTAISQLMILLNTIEKEKQLGSEQFATVLKLLAPFAPHMTEELWHELGHDTSIHLESWPVFDPSLLQDEEVTIAIQINGKVRGEVRIPSDADKAATEEAAKDAIADRLDGVTIARTIVVPGRLVNFVTS